MEVKKMRNPSTGEVVQFIGGAWVPVPATEQPLQKIGEGQPLDQGAMKAATDFAGRTFINNMLSLPSATGDLLAAGAGAVQTVAETPFTDGGFFSRLRQNVTDQGNKFPASALSAIPRPTVEGIQAAVQSVPSMMPGGESPSAAYQRNMDQITQQQNLQRQQHPIASGTGDVLGDIATLITGRSPFASKLSGRPPQITPLRSEKVRDALATITREQPELAAQVTRLIGTGELSTPGATRLWRRVVNSSPVQSFLRGTGKAAEAGLEGAVLAAMKENDPITNAGYTAGGQALTSVMSSVLGVPTSMKDLVLKAGGYLVLFRTLQEFSPGENNAFAATDDAFNKLAMGVTLGLASQFFGGRFRGSSGIGKSFAEDLPRISDAINTIPRAAVFSLLNQVQREEENGTPITLPTMEALISNPGQFPDAFRNRLQRAMRTGNLASEIEKMSTNDDFLGTLEHIRSLGK